MNRKENIEHSTLNAQQRGQPRPRVPKSRFVRAWLSALQINDHEQLAQFQRATSEYKHGRNGALRRPRRALAAQLGTRFVRHAQFIPPAITRVGTSQRDVPTLHYAENRLW
jgi:hypothetical protein